METPMCNNDGIEWNGRMTSGPPLEAPKDEKLLQPPGEEDATL